jgi:hypothetical protein
MVDETGYKEGFSRYTVKKVIDFLVPSRDVTDQTLQDREKLNYSRPGRVWSVTSRLRTGKSITFFYSVGKRRGKGSRAQSVAGIAVEFGDQRKPISFIKILH